MYSTKSTDQALLSGPYGHRAPGAGDVSRSDAPWLPGRAAPLVLIEEHLTDEIAESAFRPAMQGGFLIKNWFVHRDHLPSEDGSFVLKVQNFEAGGAEFTLRRLDLEKIGAAMERGGKRGKREAPEQVSVESRTKAGQRAKRHLRCLVKNMGATNLVTLNLREGPNTKGWSEDKWSWWRSEGQAQWSAEHGLFRDPEWWAKAWDLLRRKLEKVIGKFPYVATLERHRKGNYHLHLAWVGKVNINLMRPLWWSVAGGRGEGNVDAKYIKCPRGCNRSSIIARYISKYVSKHFEDEEEYRYNKKRYWASRQSLPEVRRYVLSQTSIGDALASLMPWLQMRFDDRHNFFFFPSGDGFWWNYLPDVHDNSPPPF